MVRQLTLGHQIVLIFVLFLFITISVLVVSNYYERRDFLIRHLHTQGEETGNSLASQGATYFSLDDMTSLEQLAIHAASDVDMKKVQVISHQGVLVSEVIRDDLGNIKVDYLRQQIRTPSVLAYSEEITGENFVTWSPMMGSSHLGWIRLEYSLARIEKSLSSALQEGISSGLFVLLLILLTTHYFLKPRISIISETARIAQSMGKSPFPLVPVNYLSPEIHSLTMAINRASIELYQQNSKILEDQKHIELLLNSIPVAVFGVDLEGVCIFHNPQCTKICGRLEDRPYIGKKIIELIFHPPCIDNLQTIENSIQLEIEISSQPQHGETVYFKIDGTQAPCEYWSHPIIRHNEIIGQIVSFVDISDRIAAEEQKSFLERQLQHSQKMQAIGQLTGGIAHDFNNILAAIMGYTILAKQRADTQADDKQQSYLAEILAGSERATGLVKQMLAFGRTSAGSPEALSLITAIQDCARMIKPIIPSSINFQVVSVNSHISVLADPIHLQQILMNLCLNASDALQGKGRLDVIADLRVIANEQCSACHAAITGEYASIRFIDNGSGIESQVIGKIFDPFFTTKAAGKGTGMGLSMVHGLVHKNHGHIKVHSTPGHGTEFELLLPLNHAVFTNPVAPNVTHPISTNAKYAHQQPPHILVIDDEESVAKFLYELLALNGYATSMETSSVAAYERFIEEPDYFDLVVTDQTMPNLSGYELADKFLKVRPDLPIVLCTGYSEQVSRERALALGIKSYHEKPINVRQFCATISSLLTGCR